MSSDPVRVAVAGCGRIARVHGRYLRGLSGVDIVAVCDPVESAVEAFAREFNVVAHFSDLGQMLRDAKPDAVHVLTPPATHAGVAVAAMEAGAHVLVEKPMALNTREADAMVAAAARTGRSLAVDHNRWFDPVVQQAASLVASGDLGDLVGVEVFQGAAVEEVQAISAGAKQHWASDLPGGVMHDLAPHPAYLLRNFVGAIDEVHVSAMHGNGTLQELRGLVRGARALGMLTISMRTRPFTNTIRLFGTRMSAEVNLNNMTLIVRRERRVPKIVGKVLPNIEEAAQLLTATIRNGVAFVTGRQRYFPGMGILIERFYKHLASGTPAPTTGEDGREVTRLLDALWQGAGDLRGERKST